MEEGSVEESISVPEDLDDLLAQTDALIENEEDQSLAIDSGDIDDLLADTDALLEPEEPAQSTLEQLSQLDTIEEPYLMTQELDDEFDSGLFSEPQVPILEEQPSLLDDDEHKVPVVNEENAHETVETITQNDTQIIDETELAPSQEAQHLVDALDSMLAPTDVDSSTSAAAGELDEFINPHAIEVDDEQLNKSMAEFDEDSVIGDNEIDSSSENIAPHANSKSPLTDAEEALNEQLPKFEQEHSFIDIDKLLDESAMNEQENEPYQNVDLDIGLDEFPEVLPETGGVDVDDDPNGASKKLDLARAYLEIDDEDSAIDMLEQVKQSGDPAQIKEVEKLMKRLKS